MQQATDSTLRKMRSSSTALRGQCRETTGTVMAEMQRNAMAGNTADADEFQHAVTKSDDMFTSEDWRDDTRKADVEGGDHAKAAEMTKAPSGAGGRRQEQQNKPYTSYSCASSQAK